MREETVMNRTVGKLARDGPSNICHFNRSRLCCEIGFWFYHCCFAKEKRGGVAVSLYAGGAAWSWLHGCNVFDGKDAGFSPHTVSMWDSNSIMRFLPFAWLMHEHRAEAI